VAAATSDATSQENTMTLDWLKPEIVLGSTMYAVIGVVIFWVAFLIVDLITPYKLWEELVERKNVALAIVVGAMCLSIGNIVAAAIHG
jgi:putative membrane protein